MFQIKVGLLINNLVVVENFLINEDHHSKIDSHLFDR